MDYFFPSDLVIRTVVKSNRVAICFSSGFFVIYDEKTITLILQLKFFVVIKKTNLQFNYTRNNSNIKKKFDRPKTNIIFFTLRLGMSLFYEHFVSVMKVN